MAKAAAEGARARLWTRAGGRLYDTARARGGTALIPEKKIYSTDKSRYTQKTVRKRLEALFL
ncbi:MAG TPA: hypothetical protein VGC56_10405 [Allosphingosinicella sp.]|jgi:hypothetical protein